MSTAVTDVEATVVKQESLSSSAHKALSSPWASLAAIVIAVLWTIPTVGLFITSFRSEDAINDSGWWTVFGDLFHGELPAFSLQNYDTVLNGSDTNFTTYLINSFIITIPAVLIPISIATMAAYAFAWMSFPGRNFLFVAIFALQIVPIQVTMIPLLTIYADLGLTGIQAPGGGFYTIWLSHSIFALPLAIYLMHNFMSQIPGELIESARVDGAGHVQIFTRIMLPLMMPAIAAFAIFQFLWVWNDLLVALVFSSPEVTPLTVKLVSLVGEKGQDWQLLASGAFVSLAIPLIVFLALQRYFVRGLLAGSVKG